MSNNTTTLPILRSHEETIILLQNYLSKLDKAPDPMELKPTPDNRAKTLPISFVEMTLDEIYFGLWETFDFRWSAITNEVQGSIVLEVTHPVTGKPIRRTGAASVIITVDSISDDDKAGMTKQARNLYALNPENKKPNALDLAFPKLKAECVKNAAQSLGKIFGRDLNRKETDSFKPPVRAISAEAFSALLTRVESGEVGIMALAEQNFILDDLQKEILRGAAPQKLLN